MDNIADPIPINSNANGTANKNALRIVSISASIIDKFTPIAIRVNEEADKPNSHVVLGVES